MRRNFDRAKFRADLNAAIRGGHAEQVLRTLERDGVYQSAGGPDAQKLMPLQMALDEMAFDAPASASPSALPPQSALVTTPNSGIPLIFTTWVDPKAIEILVTPMMAAVIAGESQKGSWVDDVAMFKTVESTGQTSSYGDYSRSGSTDVNYNFPQRQNYLFQAFLQYGDREIERAAKAKIDLPADKQSGNALALMKAMNFMNFFGVGSLLNYGLLNDPNLPPPIAPVYSWLTNSSATALTIYQDVVRLVTLLIQQTQGAVNSQSSMTLAMSPANGAILNSVTPYNTNSVLMLLKQNYPNIRLETAPEYETAAGQLVQLFADDVDGQKTVETAFSVKLMAHRVIQSVSSIEQKRTSGGFGSIVYRPLCFAQMLG
jgi:Uncharacterized protein conserved in bacteria (DUF2184)